MQKRIKRLAAVLLLLLLLSSCASLDVVRTAGLRAFDAVLEVLPPQTENEVYVSLTAPDGAAVFYFGPDGLAMSVDLAPFYAAGLREEIFVDHYFSLPADRMQNTTAQADPLRQFETCLDAYPKQFGYHMQMDHFNIDFGGKAMFEWAKDMKINGYDNSVQDKDIVFVLNPEPFIAAGVDPEQVQGWAYAQVSVEINGKPAQVWKLLKPFDLQ
ncbi:MAG: hypothetical protein LBG83_01790 [Oscillospiraceae bacterium]|jgi:hypothetical protein|nr:hypothetical protein [Oscillospiraceae bacterium]